MTEDDEFRHNAAQCQRMADATQDEQEKSGWLALAKLWLRMIRGHADQTPTEG